MTKTETTKYQIHFRAPEWDRDHPLQAGRVFKHEANAQSEAAKLRERGFVAEVRTKEKAR